MSKLLDVMNRELCIGFSCPTANVRQSHKAAPDETQGNLGRTSGVFLVNWTMRGPTRLRDHVSDVFSQRGARLFPVTTKQLRHGQR